MSVSICLLVVMHPLRFPSTPSLTHWKLASLQFLLPTTPFSWHVLHCQHGDDWKRGEGRGRGRRWGGGGLTAKQHTAALACMQGAGGLALQRGLVSQGVLPTRATRQQEPGDGKECRGCRNATFRGHFFMWCWMPRTAHMTCFTSQTDCSAATKHIL